MFDIHRMSHMFRIERFFLILIQVCFWSFNILIYICIAVSTIKIDFKQKNPNGINTTTVERYHVNTSVLYYWKTQNSGIPSL